MNIIPNHEYHVVELYEYPPPKVIDWLEARFAGRWFYRSHKIYFANAQDHMMFVLKWS
jgi:hypothetical protein